MSTDPVAEPAPAPLPEGATRIEPTAPRSNRKFRRPTAPLLGDVSEPQPTDAPAGLGQGLAQAATTPKPVPAIKAPKAKRSMKPQTKPVKKSPAKAPRKAITKAKIVKKAKATKVAKKRGGRTPKPPGEAFNNVVPLRLNDGDYAKLQLVAQRQGTPLAAMARNVMLVGLGTFRVRKSK